MSNLKTTGLVTAGFLVGMLAALTAGAQDTAAARGDAPQMAVHYSPSQLQSDEGVRHLYVRLQRAAESVCPQPASREVSEGVMACRRQAVADAVTQIHSARLAALSNTSLKSG